MDIHELDRALLEWAYGLDLPMLPVALVTHLATRGGLWLLAALVLAAFGRRRTRRAGLAIMAGLALHVVLLEGIVKHAIARTRPFTALGLELRDGLVNPESYSFPSGHSAASFLGAAVLGARFPRWRMPLLGLATAIAFSRLPLGAHYPSDVLAGAILGLLLGLWMTRAFRVTPPPIAPPSPEGEAAPDAVPSPAATPSAAGGGPVIDD